MTTKEFEKIDLSFVEEEKEFYQALERQALNGEYVDGKKVMKWFKDHCEGKQVTFPL